MLFTSTSPMAVSIDRLDHRAGERLPLQCGAAAAIGTILQVAAGGTQSALLAASGGSTLAELPAQPGWLWPLSHSGFIFGSLLSVGAVVALASPLTGGVTWALIRLAIPALIAGVTLHEVDGSLNAVGLTGLGAGAA